MKYLTLGQLEAKIMLLGFGTPAFYTNHYVYRANYLIANSFGITRAMTKAVRNQPALRS